MTLFVTVISFVVATTAVEFLFIQKAQSPSPSVDSNNNNGILTLDILFALIDWCFRTTNKSRLHLILMWKQIFCAYSKEKPARIS